MDQIVLMYDDHNELIDSVIIINGIVVQYNTSEGRLAYFEIKSVESDMLKDKGSNQKTSEDIANYFKMIFKRLAYPEERCQVVPFIKQNQIQ